MEHDIGKSAGDLPPFLAAYADDLWHNGPLLFFLRVGVGAALILLILVSSKSDR